jgi:hypothetical protein
LRMQTQKPPKPPAKSKPVRVPTQADKELYRKVRQRRADKSKAVEVDINAL